MVNYPQINLSEDGQESKFGGYSHSGIAFMRIKCYNFNTRLLSAAEPLKDFYLGYFTLTPVEALSHNHAEFAAGERRISNFRLKRDY
jgi:hypothetical protein